MKIFHYYLCRQLKGGGMEIYMASNTVKFTLRTESEVLKKFHYVAEYNARSANRELEVIMKRHIAKFEQTYGKIELE